MLQHGKRFLYHKDSSVTLGYTAWLVHFYLFEGYMVGGFLPAFGFLCCGVLTVDCFFLPDLCGLWFTASVWSHVGDQLICIGLDELEMAWASWKKEG